MFVGACAYEIERPTVAGGALGGDPRDFHLAERGRDALERGNTKLGGNLVEEILDRTHADAIEHVANVVLAVRNVGHETRQPPASSSAR